MTAVFSAWASSPSTYTYPKSLARPFFLREKLPFSNFGK